MLGLVAVAYNRTSRLSSEYIFHAINNWRWLFMQCTPCAFSLAFPNAGRSNEARIAMIATTTNNSISVKAPLTRQGRKPASFACIVGLPSAYVAVTFGQSPSLCLLCLSPSVSFEISLEVGG